PALVTRMSIRPHSARIFSANCLTWPSSVTSPQTASVSPFASAATSRATCSMGSPSLNEPAEPNPVPWTPTPPPRAHSRPAAPGPRAGRPPPAPARATTPSPPPPSPPAAVRRSSSSPPGESTTGVTGSLCPLRSYSAGAATNTETRAPDHRGPRRYNRPDTARGRVHTGPTPRRAHHATDNRSARQAGSRLPGPAGLLGGPGTRQYLGGPPAPAHGPGRARRPARPRAGGLRLQPRQRVRGAGGPEAPVGGDLPRGRAGPHHSRAGAQPLGVPCRHP